MRCLHSSNILNKKNKQFKKPFTRNISHLYRVEEIHLSMNNYDVIDLDEDEHCQPTQMHSVKRLHFTGITILRAVQVQVFFCPCSQRFSYSFPI